MLFPSKVHLFFDSDRCMLLFSQLALRAAPTYQSFSAALVSREGDELKSGFTSGMHRDLGVYLPAMEKQYTFYMLSFAVPTEPVCRTRRQAG